MIRTNHKLFKPYMYTYTYMVKPVSLSDKAYDILSSMKGKDESFSDVVLRLSKTSDIKRFAGCLDVEWDGIKKNLEAGRKSFKLRDVKL
jgi:predicted CopG family antitoxin